MLVLEWVLASMTRGHSFPHKQKMTAGKLWVKYQLFIDKVAIDSCDDVADFLNILYGRPLLGIPKDRPIALYQLMDGQEVEIDIEDSPANYLPRNSRRNPLIVKAVGNPFSTCQSFEITWCFSQWRSLGNISSYSTRIQRKSSSLSTGR